MKKGSTVLFAAATLALALSAPAFAQSSEPPPEGEVPPPPPPPPAKKGVPITAVYDGGATFRTDDGNFELKINGLLQARYELVNTFDTGQDKRVSNSRFVLPRARMGMSGYIWKNTVYKVEFSFSDGGLTRLRDFYLNQMFLDGKVQLRLGQWKRPYSRGEIASDFATEFVEKSIVNSWVGVQGSRDIGIGLTNGHEKSPEGLEWVVALFNGRGDGSVTPITCTTPMGGGNPTCTNGTPSSTPADFQPQLVARVGWNVGNIKGYSEADLEGGPLRLAVAVQYRGVNLQDTTTAPLTHDAGIDFVLKVEGLDVNGGFFMHKVKDVDNQFAFYGQAGYMVVPKTVQIALRYARAPLAPPAAGADQEYTQEIRGAFNWFFAHSHNFKWFSDFGMTQDTTDGAKSTILFRSGAQLIF